MPTQITITAYTLDELKDLDQKAYERAVTKTLEYANMDGDWCTRHTEWMSDWLSTGELGTEDGSVQEWDYYRQFVKFDFTLDLLAVMERAKVRSKYRALYNWLMSEDTPKTISSTVTGWRSRIFDREPVRFLDEDIESEIYWEVHSTRQDREWGDLVRSQLKEVLSLARAELEDICNKLTESIIGECEYRDSEAFAKEEAEALELHFEANGDIIHI